jgi:hypothetical protein
MDVRETGWEVVEFIRPAEDRGKWCTLVKKVTNFWVP